MENNSERRTELHRKGSKESPVQETAYDLDSCVTNWIDDVCSLTNIRSGPEMDDSENTTARFQDYDLQFCYGITCGDGLHDVSGVALPILKEKNL